MPLTYSEVVLAKILGNLYTEVFQKRLTVEGEPIKRSAYITDTQDLSEKVHSVIRTSTFVWVWGPGGLSDQVNVDLVAATWGPYFGPALWG